MVAVLYILNEVRDCSSNVRAPGSFSITLKHTSILLLPHLIYCKKQLKIWLSPIKPWLLRWK